jgi:hypothetical protein
MDLPQVRQVFRVVVIEYASGLSLRRDVTESNSRKDGVEEKYMAASLARVFVQDTAVTLTNKLADQGS